MGGAIQRPTMSTAVIRLFSVLLLVFAAQAYAQIQYISRGLSQEENNLLLQLHNEFRNITGMGDTPGQPPAANMIELVWDEEAAQQGQEISDTGNFEHVNVVNGNGEPGGQNIYWAATTTSIGREDYLVSAVKAWYDEYKTYRFDNSTYNHYTQLVWANSEMVGCGYTIYQNRPGWTEHLLVCNYYPAGNYIGQTPYISGPRDCPKYSLQDSAEYSGLCAK